MGSAHQLQFHHIFPKALLKKNGSATREIDDIANLAFIGGRTNRGSSDKAPAEYLPSLIASNGEQAFVSQCIPLDPDNWTPDRYRTFLAERRRLISERLNAFLDPAASLSPIACAHAFPPVIPDRKGISKGSGQPAAGSKLHGRPAKAVISTDTEQIGPAP